MPGKAQKEQLERLRHTAAKLATSPVDDFLSAGLDYKGQTRSTARRCGSSRSPSHARRSARRSNVGSVMVPIKIVRKKRMVGTFGSRKTVYDSFVMLESGDEIAKIYKATPKGRAGGDVVLPVARRR